MLILDLCAGTGAWSKPYADAGYEVRPVTLPCDVRLFELPPEPIHGILAAPPCTDFSTSGARWWAGKGEPLDGLAVVSACLRIILMTHPKWWVLENPVGRLRRWIGPPVMTFQPFEYGDPYSKRTCLWGEFSPPIKNPVPREDQRIWRMGPSPERAMLRSITPSGFARAFFEANP